MEGGGYGDLSICYYPGSLGDLGNNVFIHLPYIKKTQGVCFFYVCLRALGVSARSKNIDFHQKAFNT